MWSILGRHNEADVRGCHVKHAEETRWGSADLRLCWLLRGFLTSVLRRMREHLSIIGKKVISSWLLNGPISLQFRCRGEGGMWKGAKLSRSPHCGLGLDCTLKKAFANHTKPRGFHWLEIIFLIETRRAGYIFLSKCFYYIMLDS